MFNIGVLFLVALAGALAMSPSVADPDLWGHVQFGRDTIASGWVAETTSYSFTAEGFRWINHENLSEVTMAAVVDQFGPSGLLWGKFLLSLFVIGVVVWFNFRQGVGLIATSILTLLVAANLGYHWSFRPQLSSFFLFTLMVLLLQFCFSGWRNQWHLNYWKDDDSKIEQTWLQGRMLWLLVPLILVWTNSHGGFVAGVCIVIAYLMLRAFEAFQSRGVAGWGLIRRMVLISVAVAITTLLNPYSYQLPMWLLESLSAPRPEIVDWSNGQLISLVGAKFWLLLAVFGFAYGFSGHKRDFVQLCVLALTLWQAVSHFRHVPFFAILCGFWLGPHLQSALDRFQRKSEPSQLFANRLVGFSAYALVLLLMGSITLQLSNRLYQIQVDRSEYPVDAFAFMQKHDIQGNIVVTYNWAQYAIAAFCSDQQSSRVAFDGRFRTCYPQQIVDMHFDFLYGEQDQIQRYRSPDSPEIDPGRVLRFGNPEIAIIKRFDEVTSAHMQSRSDWCLLYQDGLAEVWGRKSRFDNEKSRDYLAPHKRIRTDRIPEGIVSWPAMPGKNEASMFRGFAFSKSISNNSKVNYVSNNQYTDVH